MLIVVSLLLRLSPPAPPQAPKRDIKDSDVRRQHLEDAQRHPEGSSRVDQATVGLERVRAVPRGGAFWG